MMGDRPRTSISTRSMAEMGELQEKIDAVDGWTLDNQLEIAMDALRCPPGDCLGREPLRRREAPHRAHPPAAREARHLAARRADQPSRRRERRNGSKSTSIDYAGHVILVTHDRYFLDNVVGWVLELDRGRYFPYEGNYSDYLEKKAKRLAQEEREDAGRQKAINDELEWIRQLAQGAPDQVQGPYPQVRRAGRKRRRTARRARRRS